MLALYGPPGLARAGVQRNPSPGADIDSQGPGLHSEPRETGVAAALLHCNQLKCHDGGAIPTIS